MVVPNTIQVDQVLADAEAVAAGFARNGQAWCDGHDEFNGLLRVLYPAYRVEYAYSPGGGLPWSGPDREHDFVLIDALWEDNDASLTSHGEAAAETTTLSPEEVYESAAVPSVLLEFHGDDSRAASVLPDRLEYAAKRGDVSGDDDGLAALREEYDLPPEVSEDTFEGIERVDRVYLPFWVAEFRADDSDELCYVAVRPTDEGWPSGRISSVGWLEQFVAGHQSLLESEGRWLGSTSRDPQVPEGERAAGPGRSANDDEDDSSAPDRGSAPADGDPDVVQPEGAELIQADRLVDPAPERSLADVGGMSQLKETLESKVLDPLRNPEQYEEYGLSTVDGVLLHGPPGCGKTYVTGAIAGELGQSFVRVSPADLSSKYMGEPAQKVQELFAVARANQPCVLFLDELDAVTGARENDDSNQSQQGMVNQLLTELEAISDEDVVVFGATNLLDDVDSAVRRSGRFDERIEVPPPDAAARREMLRVHLAGRPTADDLSLEPAVAGTAGYAASDLERVVDEAARAAMTDDSVVTEAHLEAAVDATETSIEDWIGKYEFVAAETDGTGTVVQPEEVEHLQATAIVEQDVDLGFADVGGMADLKETLDRKVLDPLREPERFESYGLDPTNGVLLYGPPGCGKTHVTRALAGELDRYFVEVSPAELTSKWMGEPAQRIADLFEIARANQPCLVFLDEIDAVAGGRQSGGNRSQQSMVNQLLTELESLDGDDVVVVGATNLLDDVDGAIRRSGRFDERVEVPPPDAPARREILQIHLADRPVADDVDWDRLADLTAGYAASDLELVADEAAHRALREGEDVTTAHLEAAAERTESSLTQWAEGDRYAESPATGDLPFSG